MSNPCLYPERGTVQMIRQIMYGLLIAVAVFSAGYYLGSGQKQIEIHERIIQGEKEIQVVERKVTVEKIIRPDGTVEERTITEDTNSTTKEKSTDISKSEFSKPILAQYSIGIQYHADIKDLFGTLKEYNKLDRYEVVLGRRVLGPAWIELGAGTEQLTLGMRYEF